MNEAKNQLRKKYIKLRHNIPISRRAIAEKKIIRIANLNFNKVLSFSSKSNEINLWLLNKKLAKENRLLLPRVDDTNNLSIFEVVDLETQLMKGKFNIMEPTPSKCKIAEIENISCVLVPGLVFDKNNNRLGYGRGYYDKFLKKTSCLVLGVGFIEQQCEKKLPTENHDIKLNHLLLF